MSALCPLKQGDKVYVRNIAHCTVYVPLQMKLEVGHLSISSYQDIFILHFVLILILILIFILHTPYSMHSN